MWWVYIHEEPTYCERQAYKQGRCQDFPLGGAELYIYMLVIAHNSYNNYILYKIVKFNNL